MKLRAVPGVKVTFKWLGAHRAILVLRGPNLSSRVSDIDPRTTGIKVPESKPLQLVMEAKRTADAINEVVSRSYEAFSLHEVNRMRVKEGKPPANIILPRGAGEPPKMETVRDKYGFESAACVAEVPLVRGVCTYAGMKVVQPRGLKGDPTTDLESVRRAILRLVKENEFVLLNVKGFDVLSHDGDVEGKVRFIERVDGMIGRLWESLDRDEVCLVLTSDHATPIYVRDHSGDPVPLAVATSAARVDEVSAFDERAVSKGGLGRIRGLDLMPILLDLIGKSKKFGA
jgi:2,3-bisphosphoglycerate-independent phosphoglycerate mutase